MQLALHLLHHHARLHHRHKLGKLHLMDNRSMGWKAKVLILTPVERQDCCHETLISYSVLLHTYIFDEMYVYWTTFFIHGSDPESLSWKLTPNMHGCSIFYCCHKMISTMPEQVLNNHDWHSHYLNLSCLNRSDVFTNKAFETYK